MILDEADLTFIAEDLGHARSARSLYMLKRLACHHSAIVREGAVYGLARRLDDDGVRDMLHGIAAVDASPGVREAAREALEP